ncbi:hypothetical protein NC652_028113 [Populus alba x Populus x berolinensis]|nr:hypothetical protein NC652_028113 [Populus alba x Populus x berolinensis]
MKLKHGNTRIMYVNMWIVVSKAAYDADKVFLAAFDKLEAMMPKGNFYAPDVGVLCWVMGDASGNVGRRLQIFVMLNTIGVLVAYMIIIRMCAYDLILVCNLLIMVLHFNMWV